MLITTPQNPLTQLTQLLAPTGNRSMDHAKLHWAIIALAPLLTSTGMFLTQYQTEDGARLVASPSQTFPSQTSPATPPYTEFTDVDTPSSTSTSTSSSTSHGDEEE